MNHQTSNVKTIMLKCISTRNLIKIYHAVYEGGSAFSLNASTAKMMVDKPFSQLCIPVANINYYAKFDPNYSIRYKGDDDFH